MVISETSNQISLGAHLKYIVLLVTGFQETVLRVVVIRGFDVVSCVSTTFKRGGIRDTQVKFIDYLLSVVRIISLGQILNSLRLSSYYVEGTLRANQFEVDAQHCVFGWQVGLDSVQVAGSRGSLFTSDGHGFDIDRVGGLQQRARIGNVYTKKLRNKSTQMAE